MANAMTNRSRVNTLIDLRAVAAEHGIRVGVPDRIKGYEFGVQTTSGRWVNLNTEEFLGEAIGDPEFSVASQATLPITANIIVALEAVADK